MYVTEQVFVFSKQAPPCSFFVTQVSTVLLVLAWCTAEHKGYQPCFSRVLLILFVLHFLLLSAQYLIWRSPRGAAAGVTQGGTQLRPGWNSCVLVAGFRLGSSSSLPAQHHGRGARNPRDAFLPVPTGLYTFCQPLVKHGCILPLSSLSTVMSQGQLGRDFCTFFDCHV